MKKKYKAFVEIDFEIDASNKKQINSLIKKFKTKFMRCEYESFGSTGSIKTGGFIVKDIQETT